MTAPTSITLCDETLLLLPELALFWQRQHTLFIADPHWGNAERLFIPPNTPVAISGNTAGDLARLDRLLAQTRPERLVILGDAIHARGGRTPETLALVQAWRERYCSLAILLVRGNHDHIAGDPPPEWGMTCVDEPYPEPPFALRHFPKASDSGYTLCGHLHPAVRPTGDGLDWRKRPAFLFRRSMGILPAFGRFVRLATLMPLREERVYFATDEQVISYQQHLLRLMQHQSNGSRS